MTGAAAAPVPAPRYNPALPVEFRVEAGVERRRRSAGAGRRAGQEAVDPLEGGGEVSGRVDHRALLFPGRLDGAGQLLVNAPIGI